MNVIRKFNFLYFKMSTDDLNAGFLCNIRELHMLNYRSITVLGELKVH